MNLNSIRNFSIIAHIDHGKSTLADRLLEVTKTIDPRKMKDQVLDSMDLERERGITIKMQPVRMEYSSPKDNQKYILNLIDTPGHIDFSYEVSRALKAVEGSILLVDSTQGVQAQTLSVLEMAKEIGLKIIPVISKIDSPIARVEETILEVAELLNIDPDTVIKVSGRTGEGVNELLEKIIEQVPAPTKEFQSEKDFRSLVFDFKYDDHKGVVVYVRVLDGQAKRNDKLSFMVSGKLFTAIEVGTFSPSEKPAESLGAGEIGYIVTGIKEPGIASVGDTLVRAGTSMPVVPGYKNPAPVVWASVYPESQDSFNDLKMALSRLRLSDASLSYEEETSGSLGRGFRCGFLGMLHLEIITERLSREFAVSIVVTSPSITYEVKMKNGKDVMIYSPHMFPNEGDLTSIKEPWVKLKIVLPSDKIESIMPVLLDHETQIGDTENFGDGRILIVTEIPLRELMRNFFDELKSASSGFASLSYEILDMRPANVTRLDILVADEIIPAFTRVVSKDRATEEAEKAVEKLEKILPRQMFATKIQGYALGRILSSRAIKALRKDVTGYLYGGDITRKMKLLEKQKKGKKKMKERGKVNIPEKVFLAMMKQDR
jgi:GTP-binding protein LepA